MKWVQSLMNGTGMVATEAARAFIASLESYFFPSSAVFFRIHSLLLLSPPLHPLFYVKLWSRRRSGELPYIRLLTGWAWSYRLRVTPTTPPTPPLSLSTSHLSSTVTSLYSSCRWFRFGWLVSFLEKLLVREKSANYVESFSTTAYITWIVKRF